ncbi:MAG: 16S rRNA (uracil(1498)-N(3))-methyltransferase [Bacteroidetes bacterium]|nr:16S rRNA (uracil(1498)-N(3))-methyltransferase [Bacteroidota bacterium]
MRLFYCPDIEDKVVYTLPKEESGHCVRVLRKKNGDTIDVIDGKGGLYKATIIDNSSNKCVVQPLLVKKVESQLPYNCHIAIAPTKNIDRVEWFLEKATEIGISEVSFLLCDHSERKVIKFERAEKVVISAVKQSLKMYVPKLHDLSSFKDFINQDFGDMPRYIAHCDDSFERVPLKSVVGADSLILIGPEGDFSPEEVKLALQKGFISISLGDSRLRTETAALYAVSIVSILSSI